MPQMGMQAARKDKDRVRIELSLRYHKPAKDLKCELRWSW